MVVQVQVGPAVEEKQPVSNNAAALLPPWRRPACRHGDAQPPVTTGAALLSFCWDVSVLPAGRFFSSLFFIFLLTCCSSGDLWAESKVSHTHTHTPEFWRFLRGGLAGGGGRLVSSSFLLLQLLMGWTGDSSIVITALLPTCGCRGGAVTCALVYGALALLPPLNC